MSATSFATKPAESRRWRAVVPGIGLGLLGTAAALYVWARPLYMSVLSAVMLRPGRTPFIDFEYVLTTATCWQRGVDVYVSNPCDAFNRPMGYSPLLLRMDFLALDRAWSAPLGLALAVLFCLSLALLVPSRHWRDQAVIGLAAFSSLSVYAVERGNIDLVVYLLALAAGVALAGSALMRLVGYVVLLIAGLLKLYPLAALVVAVRERLAVCVGVTLASMAIIADFVWLFYGELVASVKNIPSASGGYFWDQIGARQFPGGIGYALRPVLDDLVGADWGPPATSRSLIYAVASLLVVAMCAIAIWIGFSAENRRQVVALPARYGTLLQIGAVLIFGCFFAGQSVSYRAIMLLLALPGLLLLDRPWVTRRLRLISRVTIVFILIVMFRLAAMGILLVYNLSPNDSAIAALSWIGFELAWWWIISVLLALLTCFILESAAGRDARRLLGRVGSRWARG
jgi:hypothetical protein